MPLALFHQYWFPGSVRVSTSGVPAKGVGPVLKRFAWICMTAAFLLGSVVPDAGARPTFFDLQCSLCHVDDNPTCSGCHPHVSGALQAQTDRAQYYPGQTVAVTFSTPWNWPGWVRAVLYDENMIEVARITGPTGTGDDGTGDQALQLPVVLRAPAPLAQGIYTWTVAWFGSLGTGGSEFPHKESFVDTNQFEVTGTVPSTTTSTTTTTTATATSTSTSTTSSTSSSSTTSSSTTTSSVTTTSTSSTTSTTLPRLLDQFLCYKTRAQQDVSVTLSDQFDTGQYTGRLAKMLCTPADENGGGISDPDTHLMAYKIKGPHERRTRVEVVNQFGTFSFDTKKTYSLLVPTAKSVMPDPPPGPPDPGSRVDHYRCLKVRITRGTPKFPKGLTVNVADQFGSRTFFVKKPVTLCVPVDKNGEGIKHPDAYLTCFRGKAEPRTSVAGVQVNNQIGETVLDLRREGELCVPSQPGVTPTTTTSTSTSTTSSTVTTTSSTTTTTLPGNQPPTISISATPREGVIALTVEFTATANDPDGQLIGIDWDFDDGTTDSGLSVTHLFATAGGYQVTATATDNGGAQATASLLISARPLLGGSVEQQYPTRLAEGPQGNIYVTDALAGSVFVYDSSLNLLNETPGLSRPLGIAVDSQGKIYVGSDGGDNVEVFDSSGTNLYSIDDGGVLMPNDIAVDAGDILYVVDSLAGTVKVYNATGTWLRDIGSLGNGPGQLRFPAAVTIGDPGGGQPLELYVADQGHSLVQVFDLGGNFLRGFGGAIGAFSPDWQGLFARVQSLAVDSRGLLHAVDCYMDKVQLLDAQTGEFRGYYGEFGSGAGELNLPLDMVVTSNRRAFITDAENHRIQWFYLEVP